MYKVLKFPKTDQNNFFFVSDLHLQHDRDFIWGRRGYKSVIEHDADLVQSWNKTCNEDSIVFHLGDFIFNDPKGDNFWSYVKALNFRKLYLLTGNHNSGQRQAYQQTMGEEFLGDKNAELHFECYPLEKDLGEKSVIFLPTFVEIFVGEQDISLCHYAVRNFVNNGKGAWMLCGHSHGNDEGINPTNFERKVLDVGIENFGRPVSFSIVKGILDQKAQEACDHHV